LLIFSGCTLTPKTYFYTLTGITSSEQHIAMSGQHTYGVGPIFLPEALMQPGIVTVREGQRVNLSLYNIWAGNLNEAITRVTASNISQITGIDAVWPFPWDNRSRPTRQIRIVIEQLTGELGGEVVLKAKWALTEQNGETVLLQKRFVMAETTRAKDYGAYVDTINTLVNQLSVAMVEAIAELNGKDAIDKSRRSLSPANH
jgi:uncharacterized lipoprotein YmbA